MLAAARIDDNAFAEPGTLTNPRLAIAGMVAMRSLATGMLTGWLAPSRIPSEPLATTVALTTDQVNTHISVRVHALETCNRGRIARKIGQQSDEGS